MKVLIGHTGYVGETLKRQVDFDRLYRSTDAHAMSEDWADLVICCAAPAKKWVANRDPEGDRANIERLIASLGRVNCAQFVLISTVDVFKEPLDVDERSPVIEDGLQPYGRNRRLLERFVAERFETSLTVRLPGLVGPGLRKNVVFDLLNRNDLHKIDSRGAFQFYPMVNLWFDLQIALEKRMTLVHLTAEPISVVDVALQGFDLRFDRVLEQPPVKYDMRTRYSEWFGGSGGYQYSRRDSLQAIRAYAQSEPRTTIAAA